MFLPVSTNQFVLVPFFCSSCKKSASNVNHFISCRVVSQVRRDSLFLFITCYHCSSIAYHHSSDSASPPSPVQRTAPWPACSTL